MKAVVYKSYGGPEVLKIEDVKKPEPGKGEVLIKIKASAVTTGDCRMRGFNVPKNVWLITRLLLGITKPRKKIPGLWFAGTIEKVGMNVRKFNVGDDIWARTKNLVFGAYAEYIVLSENGLIAVKPRNISFEEAASIPFGALTALHFLRKAQISKDKRVLIYGASGSVGVAAIQISKLNNAIVTGVCSKENHKLIRSIGCSNCIDYKQESYTNTKNKYEIVFDCVGKTDEQTAKTVLTEHGAFISVVTSGHAQARVADLEFIGECIEKGSYFPVIDKIFEMNEIVEAQKYVETGHKRGDVVIKI